LIPTKNRSNDLMRTLATLMAQTRMPEQIIVVDQSAIPCTLHESFPAINYIHAPQISGLTEARNAGMNLATGDILMFLDDDVILEPNYVEEIVAAYAPGITGVSGIITNYSLPGLSRRFFENLFVRGAFHDDRQRIYWNANRLRNHSVRRVKQFTGAAMSFRAAAVGSLRFDSKLTGGCLAEDIDFCARLPHGAVLLIAPKARLSHERSIVGRSTAHWLDEHAQSSAYMRRRNWNRGVNDDLCFAWLQAGYAVMATIGSLKRGSLEPFRAWRRGRSRGFSLASPRTKATLYASAKETA
jgi:GT2 family glycosyltransferase